MATETRESFNFLISACGLFDVTVHKHRNKKPESQHAAVFKPEQNGINIEHLKMDYTTFNRTWPWQVLIVNNDSYSCNGLLIDSGWVITTASCIGKLSHSAK